MDRAPPNIENINEYHDHLRQQAEFVKAGPVEQRTCNDKCCCVIFLIITILFIALGFVFIGNAKYADINNLNSHNNQNYQNQNQIHIENLKPAVPSIIGMIALAFALSIAFMCLLAKFPKCMFYSMLVFTAIVLVILMILLFAAGATVGGVVILVILLIYGCFLFCVRDQIRIGITLLETASNFLLEKPSVYCAPIFVTFFVLIFEIFWIASMVAIQLQGIQANDNDPNTTTDEESKHAGLSFLWVFFHIFYTIFFYYCMVFLIATACAMWYYDIDGNYLFTGIKRIVRYHVGSFTFGALLVTIVTMLRQAAERGAQDNDGAAAICLCLVACCLRSIQDLLQTLNHNAIIVMAVTGESYCDCAKSTISLIFENFGLFLVVDLISNLITFTGSLFICGIPSVIGYFLIKQTMENQDDGTYITIGVVIIALVSLTIGALFLSLLSQALSCVFIFYCFDKKFQQMGFPIANNVPQSMRKLFYDIRGEAYGEDRPPSYGGYQQNQGNYPGGNQGGHPGNQGGYPGNQGGYPGNQGGYPGNQGGYPGNQGGYPGNQGRGGYY